MPMSNLYDFTYESTHWLTKYDPDDGEPYGITCRCAIGADHNGAGNIADDDNPLVSQESTP